MDCDRADLVIGLLEGELDPAEKAEVEAHLQGCGACRETRDAYAATLSDLRALPAERPSPEAAARAYAAVVEAMSAAAAPVGTPVAPAQAAGKVLAFPAPRARGRGGLFVQLAAAAACLLLVVALAAPQREARTAASAPAGAAQETAASRPASGLAQESPAPTSAKALREPAKPKDEAPAADAQTSSAEGEAADALALRRRAEELERAGIARERARDAAAAEAPAADEPAAPAPGARPAPSTPAAAPPPAPTTQPPSVPSGAPREDDVVGSTEPLGEPDADLAAGGRGAPPAPPRSAGAAGGAPARRQARTASALGAWRATLDGEPFDVALLPGAADGPPLVVVARRTAAPGGEDGRGADGGDAVQLLEGPASSPDLVRSLEAPRAERSDAKLDVEGTSRPSANVVGVDTRRLLLALLAHEVAPAPTTSRSEAAEVARVERVAALLAALDGRPLDGALTGDRGGRQALLRLARERVERDLPAGRSSR